MPVTNLLRGIKVPAPGDPLPESLEEMAQSTASYLFVPNVETAYSILKQAEDNLQPATVERPALFMIGSGIDYVSYVADGSRAPSGRYRLNCTNKADYVEDQPSINQRFIVKDGARKKVIGSTLSVKPYDRTVQVQATLWGKVVGRVNLQIMIGTRPSALVQFETKDDSTQHVSDIGLIPAGMAPDIGLYVVGGLASEGTGDITLSSSAGWNYLSAYATPTSMA